MMVYFRLDDVAVTRLDAASDVPAWRRGTKPITSLPAAAPGTTSTSLALHSEHSVPCR
jgi:hypothetical protein